jgi:D-hydroxyproline dehydrogenase subunit beta
VEVTVIGGGIVGCAAAALLAESGARVTLHERERIAAGASGRNQGVLQDPLDDVLTPLYEESLRLHAETAPELGLDRPPDGLLLVSTDPALPAELAARIARTHPGVSPVFTDDAAQLEPALAAGVAACRLETGHQVPPAAATEAWAGRARRAGVEIEVGAALDPAQARGDAVLVAAGPWSPVPVAPIWGVTVQLRLGTPPRHALEEAVIDDIATMAGEVPPAFAAVTAAGVTTVGATFLSDEPEHELVAPAVLERAAAFLPGVAGAERVGSRACARPVSPDGYPIVGRLAGRDRVWVATGNGPWGMTCGPGTARVAVDGMLGRAPVPATLDVARLGLVRDSVT